MPPWAPLLHDLVAAERPELEHELLLASLISEIRRTDAVPVVQLVEALGVHLNADNDGTRCRAVCVLAEVGIDTRHRAVEIVPLQGHMHARAATAAAAAAATATALIMHPLLPPQVVEAVPAVASTDVEVAHLAKFFTSRLTDWCGRRRRWRRLCPQATLNRLRKQLQLIAFKPTFPDLLLTSPCTSCAAGPPSAVPCRGAWRCCPAAASPPPLRG